MKTIKYMILPLILTLGFYCCEYDNYDGPEETLKGKIIDKTTKAPFETEAGANGVRLELMEYSWSDTPNPYHFYCMRDGTFNNTKIFKGTYGVEPQGAFVPLQRTDIPRIEIKGTVELNFEVEPFLRIEWVGQPVVNSDGTATVQVKVTRGTDNTAYQQNITDIWLYCSQIDHVGNHSYDAKLSTKLVYSGNAANSILGQVLTITTGQPNGPGAGQAQNYFAGYSRKYFLRVGARIDKDIQGVKRFNYSTMTEIEWKK